MLSELKQALYNYRLNLSTDVFRKVLSNRVTQLVLLMLLLSGLSGAHPPPPLLYWVLLVVSTLPHLRTIGLLGLSVWSRSGYGMSKFCKLRYNMYLFKVFTLTVAGTDDT